MNIVVPRQDEVSIIADADGVLLTQENRALIAQAFGDRTPSSPRKLAAQWRARVETVRRDLATIEALPVGEAAQLIRDRAAQEQARREAAERALVARKARATQLHDFTRRPPDRGPTPPPHGALQRILSRASTGPHPRTPAPRLG